MLTKQWIKQQEKYIDECDIVIAQLETPIESAIKMTMYHILKTESPK